MSVTTEIDRNRAEQTRLYGEPMQTLLGRYCSVLSLTQGKLAEVLGISAPMLSQLINGHRVKLANPASGQRLQQLHQAVAEVQRGGVTAAEAVQAIMDDKYVDVFTTNAMSEPRTAVRQVQDLFRQTASADEFTAAAATLQQSSPAIAELLITYGAARTDAALAHYTRTTKA